MSQFVLFHRRTDDPFDPREGAQVLVDRELSADAATEDGLVTLDAADSETSVIITSTLESGFEQLDSHQGRDVVVVSSVTREAALAESVRETGNRFLGRVNPRIATGLGDAAAARVVAATVRARLTMGPSSTQDSPQPSVDDERVLVVNAVETAADLATRTAVTLLAETPSVRPVGAELLEGRVDSVSLEADEIVVTVAGPGGTTAVQTDQLVWPGLSEQSETHPGVHVDCGPGVVTRVVSRARDRRREPVTVDPAVCAVGTHGVPGCEACQTHCPYDAIDITIADEGQVTIDAVDCVDCRACLAVCPTEAIASPRDRDLQTLRHGTAQAVRTGIDRSSSRIPFVASKTDPLVVAFVSEASEAMFESTLATADLPPVVPIPVPKAQRIPPSLVLYAVAAGATGVVLSEQQTDTPGGDRLSDESGVAESPAQQITEKANATFVSLDLGERCCATTDTDSEAIAAEIRGIIESATGDVDTLEEDTRPIQASYELAARAVTTLADTDAEAVPVASLGRVEVDADGCTLCEACDGLCPTGALEQPDATTLTLDAAACIGCGRCLGCPESVMEVRERIDPDELRAGRQTIVEQEAVTCEGCGRPFASAAGMEQVADAIDLDTIDGLGLEYCPDCRQRGTR